MRTSRVANRTITYTKDPVTNKRGPPGEDDDSDGNDPVPERVPQRICRDLGVNPELVAAGSFHNHFDPGPIGPNLAGPVNHHGSMCQWIAPPHEPLMLQPLAGPPPPILDERTPPPPIGTRFNKLPQLLRPLPTSTRYWLISRNQLHTRQQQLEAENARILRARGYGSTAAG
ncbi:hypothetical protein BDV96DRAFT_607809 [Lophiotrema nucula]|uniref:Uncharacterized protein n=1 Tax=Lophiotrema nucula TaxID=690887 RepID=A0A6A5YID0_9PLEO|nr:hypothetical protein BDV96DRAFT_607809 [Lophiotrema nucula]